ncbi:MAG: hypothetical protein ACOCW2_02020, partial [Chitinivibrionales bacterium]
MNEKPEFTDADSHPIRPAANTPAGHLPLGKGKANARFPCPPCSSPLLRGRLGGGEFASNAPHPSSRKRTGW